MEPNEDEDFSQGGDDDAYTEMQALGVVAVDLLEYLWSHVSEGSPGNTLSHIIRTVDARKGGVTYESIIGCFKRERDAFSAENLPQTWGYVLTKLDVPSHLFRLPTHVQN